MLLDTQKQILSNFDNSDKEFIDKALKSENVKTDNYNYDKDLQDNYTLDEYYENGKGGELNMAETKIYNADNIPDDAEVFTGQSIEFAPIDPSETYTVEIIKADLQDNFYYKHQETDKSKQGSKYVIGFEFAILDDGDFYGRRLWSSPSLALKPITKKGSPTILYKIVNSALKLNMSWEDCSAFAPDTKGLFKHLQEDVVGKQIKIAIENVTNPDSKKTRSKITSYSPVKKELPKFDAEKAKAIGEANKKKVKVEDTKSTDIPF